MSIIYRQIRPQQNTCPYISLGVSLQSEGRFSKGNVAKFGEGADTLGSVAFFLGYPILFRYSAYSGISCNSSIASLVSPTQGVNIRIKNKVTKIPFIYSNGSVACYCPVFI